MTVFCNDSNTKFLHFLSQKCSQCGATKTPMWRNDTNGNKTLCNACGVRLQRQLNKQKQQSQAIADNSTSLIAGKLPRSRTSPAKLSRQDLPRSCSQEVLRQVEGGGQKGVVRSLTLIQNSSGQPTLTIAQGAYYLTQTLSILCGLQICITAPVSLKFTH